jgi:hypothetical protein
MITNPFSAHPTFDALSTYADLNDVDRATSRLTKHVAKCAECQATVREIVALGDAARFESAVEMPSSLWSRIEQEARQPTRPEATAELTSPVWNSAPALKPTSSWPTAAKSPRPGKWLLALACAAGLGAVLFWPGDRALEASGTSRLTFSPARPIPGAVVRVRYSAASWLRGQPRLVLVGRAIGDSIPTYFSPSSGDSIATLKPSGGGAYEAEFRLPSGSPGMWLGVSDSLGNLTDVDGWRPWIAIAGGTDGKPSLNNLLLATTLPTYFGAEQLKSRQLVDAADSLRRYFPKMPAGWAYARVKEGKGTLFERMVSFFDSSERKYMSFYNELWPQKTVDAERLHEMVLFAYTIDEPVEVNRWARRLAREHPEDPRALRDLTGALHALEMKEPPNVRDSIRPWLPLLERLALRNANDIDRYGLLQLVRRYADPAEVERWKARIDSLPGRSFMWWEGGDDPAQRQRVEAQLLRDAQRSCVRPAGRFPLRSYSGSWESDCQRGRVFSFSGLARSKLIGGDARAALAFADSAESLSSASSLWCGRFYGAGMTMIEASLRLGDTARAERAAATRLGTWNNAPFRDSVSHWFGNRARSPQFLAAVDSSRRAYESCAAREKAEQQARMQRLKSAN